MPAKGFREILTILAERINDGTYPPKSKLPSLKQMREEFGASIRTIQFAVVILEDRGVITARRGKGYYVAEAGERRRKP